MMTSAVVKVGQGGHIFWYSRLTTTHFRADRGVLADLLYVTLKRISLIPSWN